VSGANAIPWRERAALSVREVAQLLGCSERAVRRLGLRTVQVGGRARIPVRVVLELMGEATPQATATEATTSKATERKLDRILAGIPG